MIILPRELYELIHDYLEGEKYKRRFMWYLKKILYFKVQIIQLKKPKDIYLI